MCYHSISTAIVFKLLFRFDQGSHRLEKYFDIEGFLEKSSKTKSALKSTGVSLQGLEKSLNFTIFCRITQNAYAAPK